MLLNAVKKVRFPFFLLILCVLFSVTQIKAAVTQLGASALGTNTNTLNFTVPAGNDRILLVIASDDDATNVATVSFGATPMIKRAQHTDGIAVDSVWTLSLGTSASSSTATITVVSTGTTPNRSAFIGAVAYQGVNQTAPISGVQMTDNTTIPSASTLNIASMTGSVVFDVFDTFRSASTNTVTPGASQTVIHNAGTVPLGFGFGFYRTSTRPGATTVPMSWTTSNGEALIHIGFSIDALVTAAPVEVGGRVMTNSGRGISLARVTITDQAGNSRLATTSAFGYFRFADVQAGETYIISVKSKRYRFAPQVISLTNDLTDLNFVAQE